MVYFLGNNPRNILQRHAANACGFDCIPRFFISAGKKAMEVCVLCNFGKYVSQKRDCYDFGADISTYSEKNPKARISDCTYVHLLPYHAPYNFYCSRIVGYVRGIFF